MGLDTEKCRSPLPLHSAYLGPLGGSEVVLHYCPLGREQEVEAQRLRD
jgi:hypothetical protein